MESGLFSETLNLWFRWEERVDNVRLLRPYLPDGTLMPTAREEHRLRVETETLAAAEAELRHAAESELERLRAQLANR